ncbi:MULTISPECIES: hypothetical protein [Aromatoleum]|uniref:Uncharacterized protein n=1 Tax=Aromatoleum buckelii TaxID=200254 RepID=A0ABX1N0U5_9RHOO|nr:MULTISPECIES: hypothetical protein [Aromatoleum]MCK0510095.1 hypothetical protein [Aromatoleum buckelii]NMG53572.1 hypothetical protein [Aromatoleum aromaticum]
MLSLFDCMDFIDLDSDTIDVIARHDRLPAMLAAQRGSQLLADPNGIWQLHQMHRELIEQAARRGLLGQEKTLRRIYAAFSRKYPMPRQM